ncbi:predicted protein [Postia placenta Mad-698-R]|uniref:Uncharacterized protein n=1 Tax=Postia placenta MAD-698-R-SB12 TaxID=670580 RepID=A0A1X6NHW4_9APHY|nr:hypothetical protein POSPLADRAFT_1129803 [Postia placenta MAD-698-R-SB12]EED85784.1 predicted protein [Postia placenta Mad-698-R]OSX68205.1 hypothetical protein POSPLADRAFT_1129803 [Postia placenta MAD-698-R-SB12]
MTAIPAFVADKVNRKMDYITSNMRTNYNALRCHIPANIIFLRRDLRELWETNRLLMIPHPNHLEKLEHGIIYKYCVIVEDEHPPDSCTTMGQSITPSIMTAPCSYRSLGWHELNANLRLMMFRAGQKLSKRPLHYQHVLREVLPNKEVNHAYSIVWRYGSWTDPLSREMVADRRLWATGELSACPDGYYDWPEKQYCSPLLDDDTVRFPRPFRPIVSGIKRKRSGDTSIAITLETSGQWNRLRNLRTQRYSLIDRRKPEYVEPAFILFRLLTFGTQVLVPQKWWPLWLSLLVSCGGVESVLVIILCASNADCHLHQFSVLSVIDLVTGPADHLGTQNSDESFQIPSVNDAPIYTSILALSPCIKSDDFVIPGHEYDRPLRSVGLSTRILTLSYRAPFPGPRTTAMQDDALMETEDSVCLEAAKDKETVGDF